MIRLENYRSYKDSQKCKGLSQVNIVIGPNNAGKSNLIRVLQWYQAMSKGSQPFSPNLQHTGNRSNPMVFEIEFEFEKVESDGLLKFFKFHSADIETLIKDGKILRKFKHEMQFGADGLLSRETVSTFDSRAGANGWVPIFGQESPREFYFWFIDLMTEINALQSADQPIHASKKKVTNKGQPNRGFDWNLSAGQPELRIAETIRAYVNTWSWLLPTRALVPRGSPGQDSYLQPNANNLVRVLNTLQTEDPDYFVDVIKKVQQTLPGLLKITAPLRGSEVTTQLREPGGVTVELADSSSGFQQTLTIVTYVFTSQAGSLVMIEEPEMNLHASAQRALLQIMKSVAKERQIQFLITSHSTIFAQISGQTSVYYVDKVEGGSRIRKLHEAPELKELKQALGHENTDLFGYNAVLILEGPTETEALPKLVKALEIDLVELGIRIMNIGGAGEIRRINHLLEFVKDTGTIPFVMLDGHSVIKNEISRFIKEKLLKQEDVLILDRDFEDCFDKSTLAQALVKVAAHHGISIQVDENEIVPAASDKSTSAILHRLYYEKTGFGLSKPELGSFIAEVLSSTPINERKLTAPEEFLKKIKAKLSG